MRQVNPNFLVLDSEMPRVRLLSRSHTQVEQKNSDAVLQLRDTVAQLLDKHSNNMKEGTFKEIYEALQSATRSTSTFTWVRVRMAVPSLAKCGDVPRAYIQDVTVQLHVQLERLEIARGMIKDNLLPHMNQVLSHREFTQQCVVDLPDNYNEWRLLSVTNVTMQR